jgi:hypothetical protein
MPNHGHYSYVDEDDEDDEDEEDWTEMDDKMLQVTHASCQGCWRCLCVSSRLALWIPQQ